MARRRAESPFSSWSSSETSVTTCNNHSDPTPSSPRRGLMRRSGPERTSPFAAMPPQSMQLSPRSTAEAHLCMRSAFTWKPQRSERTEQACGKRCSTGNIPNHRAEHSARMGSLFPGQGIGSQVSSYLGAMRRTVERSSSWVKPFPATTLNHLGFRAKVLASRRAKASGPSSVRRRARRHLLAVTVGTSKPKVPAKTKAKVWLLSSGGVWAQSSACTSL
mmetsp:Transcript_92231/g.187731  ORF Transcript_92231/g.187731 Transcript_92231/m.187731 type:complete len:219 (+) Transcript_92231:123-779(+)